MKGDLSIGLLKYSRNRVEWVMIIWWYSSPKLYSVINNRPFFSIQYDNEWRCSRIRSRRLYFWKIYDMIMQSYDQRFCWWNGDKNTLHISFHNLLMQTQSSEGSNWNIQKANLTELKLWLISKTIRLSVTGKYLFQAFFCSYSVRLYVRLTYLCSNQFHTKCIFQAQMFA